MRRSLSVKATYDGVVRLPMSLAMISTLRERKSAHHIPPLVSPRHPRRRPSRASRHHPHHRVSRARSRRDLARSPPKRRERRDSTSNRPPDDRPNEKHTKKHAYRAFPRARPASHRLRPPRVHRLSPPSSSRLHRSPSGKKNARCARVHPSFSRRTRTHRSCCQTPTHEYVVPRSIPIAGPSALLMMTRDGCRGVVKCRRGVGSRAFRFERSFSKAGGGVCDGSSLVDLGCRHVHSFFLVLCVLWMTKTCDLMVCPMGIFLGIGSVGDDSSRVPPPVDWMDVDECAHERFMNVSNE